MSFVSHSYVIRMLLLCACILSVCTLMSSVCHSNVLVSHPYVTRISSVCHSYVFVCRPYVTRMYLSVFSPNEEKYEREKLRIGTLFTQ